MQRDITIIIYVYIRTIEITYQCSNMYTNAVKHVNRFKQANHLKRVDFALRHHAWYVSTRVLFQSDKNIQEDTVYLVTRMKTHAVDYFYFTFENSIRGCAL